jgi:hypothetical protein
VGSARVAWSKEISRCINPGVFFHPLLRFGVCLQNSCNIERNVTKTGRMKIRAP